MNFSVGQKLQWEPRHWKWDVPRTVEVVRVYRRGEALLSNNVIVDTHGDAMIYRSRPVGIVMEIAE